MFILLLVHWAASIGLHTNSCTHIYTKLRLSTASTSALREGPALTDLHSVDATTAIVEIRSIAAVVALDRTSDIAPAIGASLVAHPSLLIRGRGEHAGPGVVGVGVQSRVRGFDVAVALEDVDLSVWPIVLTDRPARW